MKVPLLYALELSTGPIGVADSFGLDVKVT